MSFVKRWPRKLGEKCSTFSKILSPMVCSNRKNDYWFCGISEKVRVVSYFSGGKWAHGKRGGNLSKAGLNFTYESSNFSIASQICETQFGSGSMISSKSTALNRICFSISSDIIIGTGFRFHWFWINGIITSPINTSNSSTDFVDTSPIVIISFKLSSVTISGLFFIN